MPSKYSCRAAARSPFNRCGAPARPAANLIPSPPPGSDFRGPLARWLSDHRIDPAAAELPADGRLVRVDTTDAEPGNRTAAVVLTERNGWLCCMACNPSDGEPSYWFAWSGGYLPRSTVFDGAAMAAQSAMLRARRAGGQARG